MVNHPAPLALVLAVAPVWASAQSISVNFTGNGGRPVQAAAGSPAITGWNQVGGGSATSLVVRDDGAVDRGTRLTFSSASGGYRLTPPATSADGALFDGQIITNANGGPATVNVSGIPYSRYDLVVYVGHGPNHAGRDVEVSLGSGPSFAFQNENLQTYTDPVGYRLVTSTTVPGQTGNHVAFAGETSASFALTLRPASSGNPGSSGIAGFQILDRSTDLDNDGLDDGWELRWFGNLAQGPQDDPDADQLVNLGEFQRGTAPTDPDTDADGSTDGAEVQRNTDPLDPDTDGDELLDGVETGTLVFVSALDTGTDPLVVDTDGDGARDGAEVRRGSNPCDPLSTPDLPNVIVIMADDLGWGELGSFGQTLIRTPELDRLAAQGMRFNQFYSGSPVCAPTRCTIQTGLHTGHCNIRNNRATASLPAGGFTLGGMMQREGYVTACIGKWGNGDVGTPGHPNLQGYDHFFGFLSQVHAHWYYPSYLWRNGTQVAYPTNNGVRGPNNSGTVHAQDEMTREALSWIDQNHARPFFLYLAYTIPHVSIQEPPHSDPLRAALGETAIDEFYPNIGWAEPNANFGSSHYTSHPRPRAGYAAMISALDRDVGLVMQKLAQYGLDQNTLVLFTSDNGATSCCGVDRQFFNSMGGLRGTKGDVYEGGIRVPTIARWPGRIAPGSATQHVGAVWDILPTVADLIDAETPDHLDGVSFLPTLEGNPTCQQQHGALYWEYAAGGTNQRAVRIGDFKGVRYGNASAGAPLRVYDLVNDPAETTDVAAANPSVTAELERALAARRTFEPEWFRGNDEFPIVQNITLSNAAPYLRLDANGSTGSVHGPLLRDATEAVSMPFDVRIDSISGRSGRAALLMDAGVSTTPIRFEIDAVARLYRIGYGASAFQAPMAAATDPFGWFHCTCTYDPATGIATLVDGGAAVVQGALAASPPRISRYGYQLVDSRARIDPLDPALDGRWFGQWQLLGPGCPGTQGTPQLRAAPGARPVLAACFETDLSGAPPSAPLAFGVLGLSSSAWNGANLPIALAPLGLPGCSQWVSVDGIAAIPLQQGRGRWPLTIPADPMWLGIAFHQQALVLDPGANRAGAVVSNAGTGTVGVR